MMKEKIELVCDICGSNKIEFDATAVWNSKAQEYQYELCDGAWCHDCNDLVPVKEIIIEE